MKLRHAAALALLGWYLIAPQIVNPLGRKPYVDTHAKYRAWGVLHTFESQDKCKRARRIAQVAAQNRIPISFSGPLPAWWQENNPPIYWLVQQAEAECISTDDPRLTDKSSCGTTKLKTISLDLGSDKMNRNIASMASVLRYCVTPRH